MITLGQRIRELRLKKGLSQVDLAKGICSPSMISQVESDRARPSFKVLFLLADRLDVPLEKLLTQVELNLEYISAFRISRAMIRAKQYASAIPVLQQLLQTPRPEVHVNDIRLELADCYLQTGHLSEADQTFGQVCEDAQVRQDHQQVSLALKGIGQVEFARRNYIVAIFQWERGMEELNKMQETDPFLRALFLYNIALAHTKLGKETEAVACFEQAAQLYEHTDQPLKLAGVYHELGQSFQKLADFQKSTDYSQRAILLYEALEDIYMSLKVRAICAVNAGLRGQERSAIPLLQQMITEFLHLGKMEDAGSTSVEVARLHLAIGETDAAETACRSAAEWLPSGHRSGARLYQALGQVCLQRNQQERALRYYRQAADLLIRLDEIGEWGRTMYEMSRLHCEAGDLEQACHIMEDIRKHTHKTMQARGIAL